MNRLMIVGTGGHSRVIMDLAEKCGYEIVGFVDDFATVDTIDTIPVYPGMEAAKKAMEDAGISCSFVIAIGNNEVRKRIATEYEELEYATLVHPAAVLGDRAVVEHGSVVMAQAVIQPQAYVGAHCIINTGAIVEHDNRIGDFSHLSPRAVLGGTVTIGDLCHIGIGAVVRNNITIWDRVTIGAGAVVVKDIVQSGTFVGVPAKLMNKVEDRE